MPQPQKLQSSAARLASAQRRKQIAEYRAGGFTIQEIADSMSMAVSSVHRHLVQAKVIANNQAGNAVERKRQESLAHVELMIQTWAPLAMDGNLKASRELREWIHMYNKMFGFYAPTKQEHKITTSEKLPTNRDELLALIFQRAGIPSEN